MVGDER
ncbi:Hypothetical protein SSCIU_02741 [Mammaliicoccus sciuri]|nr:Hypothetical protein SSCIU_02741 [Mammaliicoccus sciuri]